MSVAWDIVAVTHDGEFVCPDCWDENERAVVDGAIIDDINVVFVSDLQDEEYCGRCNSKIGD